MTSSVTISANEQLRIWSGKMQSPYIRGHTCSFGSNSFQINADFECSAVRIFRNLDEKIFRKKHLLSKTRIVQKDLTLVLLVKRAGIEEKFKEFDEEFDLSDELS